MTPDATATFFDSPARRARRLQADALRCRTCSRPTTRGALAARRSAPTTRCVSPDGRVALLRLQYPHARRSSPPTDLDRLKALGDRRRRDRRCGSRWAATCSSPSSEPTANVGELVGILAAAGRSCCSRSGRWSRPPCRSAWRCSGSPSGSARCPCSATCLDVPSFAPVLGAMVGLGVGIDYALFVVTRHREYLRARRGGRGRRSAARVATAGQSGGVRRRASSSCRSSAWPSRGSRS